MTGSDNGISWRQSLEDMRAQQHVLLERQLRRLWESSPFLRSRWEQAGWTRAPDVDDFHGLPMIAKSDLREALATGFLGSHLACPPAAVRHIHATSGTSGRPTYFGLTQRDHRAWLEAFIRGFEVSGADADDVVLHAFAMSRGYAGGVPMVAAFQRMGCTVLATGAEAGSTILSDVITRLSPSLLYASPSMLRRLAARFEEETGSPAADSSVAKVITGGEPGAGDPASKRALTELWGAQIREAGGGSDICPLMWAECDEQDGLHFVAGDEVLLEVVHPETGDRLDLDDDVEGEIVYTHLQREANPVVRMRHGDVIRLTTRPCACGLPTPRIRFLGRSDEMLIVRGVKVFPSGVQQVVSEFSPPLTGQLAIKQPEAGSADRPLEILCAWDGKGDASETARQVEARARAILGVRVSCRLVPRKELESEGQKATWVLRQ